jgi:four helix bundle protein
MVGMARIERFEDIEAWKMARELSRAIYKCSSAGAFSRDFALQNQMRRAAVSILSNIAEGFEREGSREFAQQLAIAKGSAGEVQAQLYIALDQQYVTPEQFAELYQLANSTRKLIAGFMTYLKRSSLRGAKYK